jgi:hypothetical protein
MARFLYNARAMGCDSVMDVRNGLVDGLVMKASLSGAWP